MAKLSKEPYPGISKEVREAMLAKLGCDLRENKRTGELYPVKKRQVKRVKR